MGNKRYRINVTTIVDQPSVRIPLMLTEEYRYDGLYAEVTPESNEILPLRVYTDDELNVPFNLAFVEDQTRIVLEDPDLTQLFTLGEVLKVGMDSIYNGSTVVKIENGSLYVKTLRSYTTGPDLNRGVILKFATVTTTGGTQVITGTTSSKFDYITLAFPKGNYVIGEEVKLKSIDDYWGRIHYANSTEKKYEIHSGGKPITYIDKLNGRTTFSVVRDNQELLKDQAIIPVYHNMLEEPKITNNLFIERGVNTVFDPLSKLHSVKNMQELEKSGFNYFKVNKTGFDF